MSLPDAAQYPNAICFDNGQCWYSDGTQWTTNIPAQVTTNAPGSYAVNTDTEDWWFDEEDEPECECGSEAVGSPFHSSWCPVSD